MRSWEKFDIAKRKKLRERCRTGSILRTLVIHLCVIGFVLISAFFSLSVQSSSYEYLHFNHANSLSIKGSYSKSTRYPSKSRSRIWLAQAEQDLLTVQDAYGETGKNIPLNIKVKLTDDTEFKFIMIKGLPDTFNLSAGFKAKNTWLVSLKDINNLNIIPEDNFSGNISLQIFLASKSDSNFETDNVNVSIAPETSSSAQNVEVTSVSSANSIAPEAEVTSNGSTQVVPKILITKEEEDTLMKRADKFLDMADISSARLIYEVAAAKGSARAAFAMGQTFDVEFLRKFSAGSLRPDLDQAREWYKKALELGSADAESRLATLNNGN